VTWTCENCGSVIDNTKCSNCLHVQHEYVEEENELEPQVPNEPLHLSTTHYGSSLHNLIVVNPNQILFRPNFGFNMTVLILILMGGGGAIYLLNQRNDLAIIPILIFLGATIAIYTNLAPKVFDKQIGYYWTTWNSPTRAVQGKSVELNRICAVQIIFEKVGPSAGHEDVPIYQLNLVLEDLSRINVVAHGNVPKIEEEAKQVSSFLEVPVIGTT